MTVRHMKIFLQVYQQQNITRAAETLHMTQPAVTRVIQEIEQYYGICLFERINRRIYRTEAAKNLYSQALHIVDSFEKMEKGLRDWDEFGMLRIGASITLGNFLLPELLTEFQRKHPGLRLQAKISNGAAIQRMLCDNQLDIAFIEGSVEDENLEKEIFAEDHMVLILPPDHELLKRETVFLKDLLNYPLLLREAGSAGRTYLDHVFAAKGLRMVPLWESASTQAIVKAVNAGIGISLLPDKLVKKDIASGFVAPCPIADETLHRYHYMVWHKNKYLTKSAQELLQRCRNILSW